MLGLATLLLRPTVWVLVAAAFFAGVFYERTEGEARCLSAGGAWDSGVCEGVAR